MKETHETFFSRIRPLVRKEHYFKILLAYDLAKNGMRGQDRMEVGEDGKRIRAFEHSRRTALIFTDELQCYEPVQIICALLHDIVEDSRDFGVEFIHHFFGWQIAEIVAVVSKVGISKEEYIPRLADCNEWRALMVKEADRLDNLRTLHGTPLSFRKKQIKETKEKYLWLFARLISDVPGRERERAKYLYNEVLNQVQTHEAILETKGEGLE